MLGSLLDRSHWGETERTHDGDLPEVDRRLVNSLFVNINRPLVGCRDFVLDMLVLFFLLQLLDVSGSVHNGAPTRLLSQGIELQEVFAVPLPDSFPLIGATISGSGVLAIWSSDGAYVVVKGKRPENAWSELHPIGHAHVLRPIGAVFVRSDTVLEVVDAAGPSVLGYSLDNTLLYERRLELRAEPEVAVHDHVGWFLGVPDTGRYRVYRADTGVGQTVEIFSVVLETTGHDYLPIYQLSVGGEELFLAMTQSPFEVYRIGLDGRLLGVMSPGIENALDDSRGAPLPLLIALVVVPLGDRLLQTHADLSSDLRIFTLYDSVGQVLRQRRLDAPIGLITSSPDRRLVLAARWTGRPELVGYTWRWSDAQKIGREE